MIQNFFGLFFVYLKKHKQIAGIIDNINKTRNSRLSKKT